MNPYKLYIMQTSFDGTSYTTGDTLDTLETWNIVCAKSPYRRYGDPKDVATRNWLDEHGEDVYIPQDVKYKKFDAEFTFICNGAPSMVKQNVKDFLKFLSGKACSQYNTPVGPRLAIYDAYNDIGWKDVRLKSFSNDGLLLTRGEDEVVLEFKVVFEVFDPFTAVIRRNAEEGITW